jgi:hypothetical protein
MEISMNTTNVIELDAHRQHPNRDRDVPEAMWHGIANSTHSKDPDHPELPGTLAQFATHVANIDPLYYFSLLAKYMESPTSDDK